MATITIAVEGSADIPVVRRIVAAAGHQVSIVHGGHGKSRIDRNITGYNNAARFAPWLVVRDLDHDGQCPVALLTELLPRPAEHMRLRIAVREMESWLMADSEALAKLLSITTGAIPVSPDDLQDPKAT